MEGVPPVGCLTGMPEAEARANTQTQDACDLVYDEIQIEFGIASAEIYLEQGCFEMPVLHVPDLLAAQRDGRSPFVPRSLLHLALVAAAIPWLSSDLLMRYGYDNREEALRKTVETFDKVLSSSSDLPPLTFVQALLLVIYGSNHASATQQPAREARWLRLAIVKLQAALALSRSNEAPSTQNRGKTPQQTLQTRLLRRLWWCTFVTEQSHFLRSTLEDGQPSRFSGLFALNPRGQHPLSLADMDLTRSFLPFGCMSTDWSRVQRAACFIQKTLVFSQLNCIILQGPKLPKYLKPPRLPRKGYIRHSEQFWMVESMEQKFLQYLNDNKSEDLRFPQDEILFRLQVDVILIFCRIMIFLSLPSSQDPVEPDRWLWRQMRQESMTRSVLKVLSLGKMALKNEDHSRLLCGRTSSLLRAVTMAIKAATSEACNLIVASKREEMREILSRCLDENEHLWSDFMSEPESELDGSDYESDSTIASSFISDVAMTPIEAWTETRETSLMSEKEVSEHLVGQQGLLNRFDEMWNENSPQPLVL